MVRGLWIYHWMQMVTADFLRVSSEWRQEMRKALIPMKLHEPEQGVVYELFKVRIWADPDRLTKALWDFIVAGFFLALLHFLCHMGSATPRPLQRKCYTKNWRKHGCDISKMFAYWHIIATSLCIDVERLHADCRVPGALEVLNRIHNSAREK